MSPPRDERGRFVRADGKPTLHRQVADDGLSELARLIDALPVTEPRRTAWPWVFLIVSLILVAVMGVWLAAADAGLVP